MTPSKEPYVSKIRVEIGITLNDSDVTFEQLEAWIHANLNAIDMPRDNPLADLPILPTWIRVITPDHQHLTQFF